MNFYELESLMSSRGITSLAEIARSLNTTPQAVSNWKSRNQVPHHIVANLNKISQSPADSPQTLAQPPNPQFTPHYSPFTVEEDTISLSDILLTMAEQLKVIVLTTFISVFLTFTYVQFIQQPQYVSWATVLLPENKMGNLGGLAGLASQFGVNVPMETDADLSSPSLYPEILRSRTFAEKILDKEFYLDKYDKKLSLLSILTHGNNPPNFGHNTLVSKAVKKLNKKMLWIEEKPNSTFSVIRVTAPEPLFAKELADVVLTELESLNRFYKSQIVGEKKIFIESRIAAVEDDLDKSEQLLKDFNQKNRQVTSPSLLLELGRLERNVEIQEGVFLTLKQQIELAKIEEVQKTSIIQVLDNPVIPFEQSNKNIILSILLSGIVGLGFGILIGFVRSYFDNSNKGERKKLRRIRHFIKKKSIDIIKDSRLSGVISILLLIGMPLYFGHISNEPIYFKMYSAGALLINILYLLILLLFIFLYIKARKNQSK